MQHRVRGPVSILVTALLAVSTGCAAQSEDSAGEDRGFLCGDVPVTAAMLDDPIRIADLDAHGRSAVETATYDDGSPLVLQHAEEWQVIVEAEDRIVMIRPVADGALDVGVFDDRMRTNHELLMLTTDLWPGWAVGAQSNCALTVDLGDLAVPFVALDPASPPSPGASSISLLVLDPQCGGDTDMPARIEVVSLEETDTEVRVLLGVSPLPGGVHTCEGFPPTPFELELDEPLGDRTIIDGTRATPRELTLEP